MKTELQDIVKHTQGVSNNFLTVKITGADDETKIESVSDSKNVILKGSLNDPLSELRGEFGLNQMGMLKSFLDFPNYKADDATVEVKYRDRPVRGAENGETETLPEEIIFSGGGSKDHFRLMAREVIDTQPNFVGVDWEIEIAPSKSKIQEFIKKASIYSSASEANFGLAVDETNLTVYFGDEASSNNKGTMILETDVEGTLKGGLLWPIKEVIDILKLADGTNCTFSIASRGALMITIDSEIAEYRYILPAKRGE